MLNTVKGFFKQTFLYGFVAGLSSLMEFLLLPIYSRYLMPAQFGQLDLVIVFIAITTTIAIFELTSGVFRFYFDDTTLEFRQRLISTIMIYLFTFSSILAITTFIFSGNISQWLFANTQEGSLFRLAGIMLTLNCIFSLPVNLLRMQDNAKKYVMISLIQLTIAISCTISFITVFKMGIEGILYAKIISYIPTTIMSLWIQRDFIRPKFDWRIFKQLIAYSAPLIPVGAAIWLVNALNRLFLVKYCGLNDIGLFSVGLKFTVFITLMVMAFQLAWPQFAFSRMNTEEAGRTFAKIFSHFSALSLWMVIFVSLFGGVLLRMQTTPAYFPAESLMFPLALGMMFYGMFYIFTTGLNITRKTVLVLAPLGIGFGVNIILNFLITPIKGVGAVAWITTATYFSMASATLFISQKLYYIPFEWRNLLKLLATGILVAFGAKMLSPAHNIESILGRVGIFLSFPIILFAFGYIDKNEKAYIKQKLVIRRKSTDIGQHSDKHVNSSV